MFALSVLSPFIGLINGPIFSIIDKLVPDKTLKAKLKAQIQSKLLAEQGHLVKAQRDVLLQEMSQGSRLTRSWRPILMYVIILFMLVYGLFLPILDLLAGYPIAFKPRWADIPDGLWNLLSLGVGGYIGGRSLEKIAGEIAQKSKNTPDLHLKRQSRRRNFNR